MTQSGSSGVDAYIYELAQIVNRHRELLADFEELKQLIDAENPGAELKIEMGPPELAYVIEIGLSSALAGTGLEDAHQLIDDVKQLRREGE